MKIETQTVDTPVTSRKDHLQWAKAVICRETSRLSAARWPGVLRAIILTGSLARDEATFVEENDRLILLGDADFFLVFHQGARLLPSQSTVESVAQEVGDILSKDNLIASIGLSAVDISYLQGLPCHISPYELRACGCVVWGDPDVLSLVPALRSEQISLEDAWRLLANRIVELLEAIATTPEPQGVLSQEVQYRTVKLYLDMATSYLVFAGKYLPTYRQREQALRQLVDDPSAQADAPFLLRPFADRVSACTKFKLAGYGPTHVSAEVWEDAVRFAHLLWRWELTRLTGQMRPISDSKLMSQWMKQQSVKVRIRGWASVLRRSGWLHSWREWPRWIRLGWQASPRHWLYSVTTEIFFRLPSLRRNEPGDTKCESHWKSLSVKLPLPDGAVSEPGKAAWQTLARRATLNYRTFLENTVA